MGGVYRDQGLDVVSKWLKSLLRPKVEVAYQSMREDYLPTPIIMTKTEAPSRLEAPSSPFSSTSLEGAGTAFPSYLPSFPRDHRQLTTPEASVPPQTLALAGDDVGTRRAEISLVADAGDGDPA